jgi:hypothetical protein
MPSWPYQPYERGVQSATKEDVADIRKTMATKADVHAIVRDELASIRSELKSIRGDLDYLREKVEKSSASRKKSTTHLSVLPPSKSISASIRKSPPDRPITTVANPASTDPLRL